jgi:hypothetical protein
LLPSGTTTSNYLIDRVTIEVATVSVMFGFDKRVNFTLCCSAFLERRLSPPIINGSSFYFLVVGLHLPRNVCHIGLPSENMPTVDYQLDFDELNAAVFIVIKFCGHIEPLDHPVS